MGSSTRLGMLALAYVAFEACSGESACGGCVEPIPGGYPLDKRVENAVQTRLTPNAITFLENNFDALIGTLLPGGLSFPIDESTHDVAVIGRVTICRGGGCSATVNIRSVDIRPTPPSSIVLVANLEVVTSNIPVSIARGAGCVCWEDCRCDVDFDTRRQPPPTNAIHATLTLSIDSRTGYTDLDVAEVTLADGIQVDDIRVRSANTCGTVPCFIAGFDWVKREIVRLIESQLAATLQDEIGTLTCLECPATGCPTGSTCNSDDICEYPDGDCVPILLGIEGQTDLGPSLGAYAPALRAPIMFVDAAGGYARVDDGVNLGLYGGLEAVERNSCVPATYTAPWLSYGPVPRATEFSSGSTAMTCRRCPAGTGCGAGFTCSDSGQCVDTSGRCQEDSIPVALKVGVAETYLNRIGAGMFESGALCLTVTTGAVEQLNSGLMNLLFPALKVLTWDQPAPMGIEIRPQLPPRFEVRDSPLLAVRLDDVQLDFYLWMLERYVKIMTVQMDLTAPINLTVESGAIVPSLGALSAENIVVTDGAIIGPPNNVSEVFADLIELIAGMVPAFDPIELPEFSGFVLQIPEGGIRHVAEAGEHFLALYGNLAIAPPPRPSPVQTEVELVRIDRAPAAETGARIKDLVPTVVLAARANLSTPSDLAVEYRWRVDGRSWSKWTRNPRLAVRDAAFLFTGDHYVEVQARLADAPETIDRTPAVARIPGRELPGLARGPRVHDPSRVEPETGLRGRPTDTGSSGCGCAVPGGRPGPAAAFGLCLAGLAAALRRRRRRLGATRRTSRAAAVAASILAVVVAFGGCDCGSGRDLRGDAEDDAAGDPEDAPVEIEVPPPDPLLVGFVGQHSEVAVDPTGEIWVSGYSAGASARSSYGDLVVGTWDRAAREMRWTIVDGVPSGATPTGDPTGWRGGVSEPGDDVGKYTTIVIGTDGAPVVAYFDQTNGALKLARYGVGETGGWRVNPRPIDDAGEAGRYADMAIGADGRLSISYNAVEERTGTPGQFTSKVKVARSSDAAYETWEIAEVESVDIPCWKALCGETRVCLASGRLCATPDAESVCGASGCPTGEACVGGSCREVFGAPIDFPEGVGIITGIALTPAGDPVVVYYDRTRGDLRQAAFAAGAWTVTTLAGADTPPETATDAGWYPSIAIDSAGRRHVAFVDGIREELVYLDPDGGVREVVDGRSATGRGRTIVGDDSTIRVSPAGVVWISYQDATQGALVLARRTGPGAWDVRTVDDEDFSGFYANMVLAGPSGETPVVSAYFHRTTAGGSATRTTYTYASGVRVFEIAP